MMNALVVFLLSVGTFFMLVSSIGLVRMPDVYTRMHTVSKGSTLGLVSLLLASGCFLACTDVTLKVFFAVVFHFLTNPVGVHMIARAAYFDLHIPFWNQTLTDEWKDTHPEAKESLQI